MNRLGPCCFALLGWLIAAPVSADLGGFVIERFHTDLQVMPDASLLVEEHIEIRFLEPRHGFYRTIPVRYTDPSGYAYALDFRLLSVRDQNGRDHETRLTNKGRYIELRMGDPDRTVVGQVVYHLRYRIQGALGHFPEYDELYWNAIGHEFEARIDEASATVRLPASFETDALRVGAYLGAFGSKDQDVQVTFPEPGVIGFAAQRALEPREGLSVAVGWPKGAVEAPGPLAKSLRFLGANWVLLLPLLLLAWLWRRYRQRGRDPVGKESIVVRYEPPPGASAAEVGTVVDERVDLRDITATLVDLAVRGYLEISTESREAFFGLLGSEETVFERLERGTDELLPHEREVLDGIFSSGPRVELSDLKEKFYKRIPAIRDALQQRMVEQGWFTAEPSKVRQRYYLAGPFFGALVFLLGLAWAKHWGGAMPHALLVPMVAGIATAVLFISFGRAMPQRTRKGVDLKAWALGFQEFVDRVESENLEAARQRDVFEALLPYAMSLGVAAAWARRFEGIYEQQAPSWFVGQHGAMRLSTSRLESDLSTAMSQTAKVMSSAPRSQGSSGSGGGGFSGGGGGGGGGGSW
jgi:hypothetical protein